MKSFYKALTQFLFHLVPTGIPENITASQNYSIIAIQWPPLPDDDFTWKDYIEYRQYMVNYTLFYGDETDQTSNTTFTPEFDTNSFDAFQLIQIQVAAFTRALGNFSEPACIFTSESSMSLC